MNSLPDPNAKPAMGTIIPKGQYVATIVKSTMKTPKDTAKPDYLSAECDIKDPISNAPMGKFWINLYESEAPLVRYQLSRFINATGIRLSGEFELKDLTKLINGKQILVDIKPEEKKDGSAPQRSVVDIDAECFYPLQVGEFDLPDEVFRNAVSTPEPAPTVQARY
jgi:hypothetical protein